MWTECPQFLQLHSVAGKQLHLVAMLHSPEAPQQLQQSWPGLRAEMSTLSCPGRYREQLVSQLPTDSPRLARLQELLAATLVCICYSERQLMTSYSRNHWEYVSCEQ